MLRKFDYDKTPVVEIVNDILVDASKRGASDIHFDPLEQYMKIRIRIDGALIDYAEVPNSIKKNLITRIKIISGMNITETRLPQDGAIKATLQDINLDLRVSCLPTLDGEKIVIRILDYSMSSSGLETLGFSEKNYEKVLKMISLPNGIILVTGATGSGKSTTVYSILQRLNREETNIITVEDPIEMNIEGINQVQTNSEIGLTFATALRSILRQDPNVIMIGEIRDTETARIAVRASITGHIVLSTIHTNSSLNTIERLLDMEVERYLLASALTGIISQKLARRLCTKCRVKKKTNQYEKDLFKRVLHRDIDEIYTTEGCEECGNGYKGRIAIQEVLLVNQEIKDAISSNLPKEQLRKLVYSADVTTLLEDGLEKVAEGLTTFEEVLKLIELENDDKVGGSYDLKSALDYTSISQSSNDNNSKEQSTQSSTENKMLNPIQEDKNNLKEQSTQLFTENKILEPTQEETVDEEKNISSIDHQETTTDDLNSKFDFNWDDIKSPTSDLDENLSESTTLNSNEKKEPLTDINDDDDLMNMDF